MYYLSLSTTLPVQDLAPTVVWRLHWTVTPTLLWCLGHPAAESSTTTPRPMPLPSHTRWVAPPTAPPVTSVLCTVGRATGWASVDKDRTAPVLHRTGSESTQVTESNYRELGWCLKKKSLAFFFKFRLMLILSNTELNFKRELKFIYLLWMCVNLPLLCLSCSSLPSHPAESRLILWIKEYYSVVASVKGLSNIHGCSRECRGPSVVL